MHPTFSRITIASFALAASGAGLVAQTGSITGIVSDRNTRQPIEQAMVTVQGTSYGIYTKPNGTYTILGVPPGTYTVTAKRVGYSSVDAQNVTVRIDITRTQDFELSAARYGELLPLAPTAPRAAPAYASAIASQLGPGSVFGIDAYECANCGVARYRDSTHVAYTFGAEPVVTAVGPLARERIRPGDVIVAVNGSPITTRAGADMFAYPDSGEVRLTLRRNGTNIDVTAYSLNVVRPSGVQPIQSRGARGGAVGFARSPTADSALRARLCGSVRPRSAGADSGQAQAQVVPCPPDSALRASAGAMMDSARARSGGRGGAGSAAGGVLPPGRSGMVTGGSGGTFGAMATNAPGAAISSTVELRNYGFTLSCRPDCTRMRSRAGVLYWKFEGYPTVAVQSLVKDGLAEKIGIREGDVVVSVNGLSPLSEEGAVLLNRSDRELELTLELSRGGKREKYKLKL